MAGKQPLKKKEVTTAADKFAALRAFKEKSGLIKTVEKEPQWLIMPDAFTNAVHTNLCLGTCIRARGLPNTGKSTLKLEIIKACQHQGILPVVFELENNFGWEHAKSIGVNISEEVDPETGEIVYGPADDMLYYDTAKLYEIYGKFDHEHGKWLTKSNRETYVIEDVALCIRDLIRKQNEGEIPFDMFFIIDSIGVGDCYRSAVNNTSNNMWYAGAVSVAFNTIVSTLIPQSRSISSTYTNSIFIIQKLTMQTLANGLKSANSKGGISLDYAMRQSIYMGGVETAGVKKLSATSGGRDYKYGTKVKIQVEKNHITDVTYEGEICCTAHGFWDPDKLDEYKKLYGKEIKEKLAQLCNKDVSEVNDIEYEETELRDGEE